MHAVMPKSFDENYNMLKDRTLINTHNTQTACMTKGQQHYNTLIVITIITIII